MNRSIEFLNSIDTIGRNPIPSEVVIRMRQSFLDYLSVTSAGAKFQQEKLKKYIDFAQPEEGSFTAVGMRRRFGLKEAVFLNGLNGHALDFDDGTNSGIIHLGSPIFSLLLPLAEQYDISLEKLLKAAVIGYETSYTMAISMQPGHKALGYHATGTCGILGAVTAASYMLDFCEEERFHSFAAACVSATGMLKALDDGSELKPYNVAKTALLALTSMQLAKAGFSGSSDPLSGERGYFKMMTGRETVELKPLLFEGTYAVQKTYTKPYASCRYTHPAIEATIQMREEVRPEEVESIQIKTYDLAVSGHDHIDIKGSYSAKMSIPYAVAVGMIYGKAGLQEFSEEAVKDEFVLNLTKKIRVEADESLSEAFPHLQSAIVTIQTEKSSYTKRVDFPKGEPENPLTDEEFRKRYDDLMEYAGVDSKIRDEIFYAAYRDDILVDELVKKL